MNCTAGILPASGPVKGGIDFMAQSEAPLTGRTIAVPECREIERFAALLEAEGATVVRCPLVGILEAPDPAPVEAWLRRLAAGKFHDVILMTGEGVRRLMSFAQHAGIEKDVLSALAKARKITRGPKPAKALTEIGLRPDLPSVGPTTAGIIETLKPLDLSGHTVGVQLYGEDPNLPLMEFLISAGATPKSVAPYIYAPAADDLRVVRLLEEMAAGKIDALAFTSTAQVRRLKEVAAKQSLGAQLAAGLKRTKIAAIGPVVAGELREQDMRCDIIPRQSFVLKQLLSEIIASLRPTFF